MVSLKPSELFLSPRKQRYSTNNDQRRSKRKKHLLRQRIIDSEEDVGIGVQVFQCLLAASHGLFDDEIRSKTVIFHVYVRFTLGS